MSRYHGYPFEDFRHIPHLFPEGREFSMYSGALTHCRFMFSYNHHKEGSMEQRMEVNVFLQHLHKLHGDGTFNNAL